MATGPQIPKSCTTLELKDLSDLTHFDTEAEVDAVYAFQFTEDGFYRRKEIDDDKRPRFPKFDQLRDVETVGYQDDTAYNLLHSGKKWLLREPMIPSFDQIVDTSKTEDNIEYKLVHSNGKWTLKKDDIDWLIKFEFKSPVTLIGGKTNLLRKALNAGPLLVSLIPANASREDIAVKPFKRDQYLIHRLESTGKQHTIVNFIPEILVGDKATLILDLVVKPLNDKVSKAAIMDGIMIGWVPSEVEEVRLVVAVEKNGQIVKKMTSDTKISVTVDQANFNSLKNIYLTHFELIAFYYIDKVLPTEILENFTEKITL